MNWDEIFIWIEELSEQGVDAAEAIYKLNLKNNIITMRLFNTYEKSDPPMNVDINISLTADQNVRKYFGERKSAIIKQQKTLASSTKALKSAQLQIKNKVEQVFTLFI